MNKGDNRYLGRAGDAKGKDEEEEVGTWMKKVEYRIKAL